ncbi:MAG: cytochrome c oxidase subunit II [Flavobacteriia bacterium]|nr:cytochrome c oxidase subunit II [Flavobacteriia bacterium]
MESKLIILIAVILGTVALAQLVRVYELSAKLRKNAEHEVPNRDNVMNARFMLVFMLFQFFGLIYLMLKYGWTGRGEAASIEGVETDWLLNLNFVIILIGFFLTNFLLFYFSFKYVRKPGVKAYYYPHNNKLEMIWTIIPAIVLAAIIILGLKSWNKLTAISGDDAVRIELFAKQYDWTARYAGADNVLGRHDYKLTADNNELALVTSNTIDSSIRIMLEGTSGIEAIQRVLNNRDTVLNDSTMNVLRVELSRKERLLRLLFQMKGNHAKGLDNSAWDDIIQKDTLYLCVNQPYEFNFRAKDVLHSAYFPHFRAQMNAVPGMTTRTKFKPIFTTQEMRKKMNDPKFNFVLLCNKICGGAHYKMKMIIVVKDKKSFDVWMKQKSKETFGAKYFPAVEAIKAPVVVAPANM